MAREELVALIERVMERDWLEEERALLALDRLRALTSTLQTIPFNRARWDNRLASWIEHRTDEIRYNEPGGHWLIDRQTILAQHEKYRATAASDDLAWFAVQNGLPGECEGFLVCYVERSDELEGEYLRREPRGAHTAEATERIERILEYYRSISDIPDVFNAQTECVGLSAAVSSLSAAVLASNAPRRLLITEGLRDLLALCS